MEGVFKFWQNVEQRAKSLMPPQVFPAVVKEVDEDMRTCTVRINDNVDVEDVRLYAVIDDSLKGFCLIPAIDSTVLVGAMDGRQDFYVVMFSEVDKVLGSIGDKTEIAIDEESLSYKVDKTEIAIKSNEIQVKTDGVTFTVANKKVVIDADEINLNGTNNSGIPKVQIVKDNLDSIKNYLTAMDAAIVAGLDGIGAGPTAAGKAGVAAYQSAMTDQSITIQDMANDKVKH